MAEVEVITVKQIEALDSIMMDCPELKKVVHKILSSVLQKARTAVSRDARSVLNEDPRQAYRAVKRAVYKRILGGSISLLNKTNRRASYTRVHVNRQGKLVYGQRGGNRRARSSRTDQIDSYFGADRGFILRFVNAGTDDRSTRYGNRGRITPRNWFSASSQRAMENAAEQFCDLIDAEIERIANQNR